MGNPFKKIESESIKFTWLQVTIALIKAQGIHSGLWRIGLEFGLNAAVVKWGSETNHVPGAFLPVVSVDLKRMEQPDALTVDAALVNPERRIIHPIGSTLN